MDRPRNIIIISTADWDNPFWTNKQHVAMTLSELGHNVVYFESLGLRNPSKESKRDMSRILSRLKKFLAGPQKIKENLMVFSPIIVPKHSHPLISKVNTALMRLYIKYFELRLPGPVTYWTYNPLSGDFLDSQNLVYHCVDDLTAAPGLPFLRIQQEEKKLIEKSKIVFVTSKTLKTKFDDFGFKEKVHYFPNVTDPSHFAHEFSKSDKPEDLRALPEPLIGFIGAISPYKLDLELIAYLAGQRPDWSFVLIGQIGEGQPDAKIDLIEKIPNVHLLGPKSYKDLPIYLSFFSVALLPCVINDYTRSMFPMKFFEYLSAKKNVVTTSLESLEDLKDCCYFAESHEDFLTGIERALRLPYTEFCNYQKVETLLSDNTWIQRTKKMLQLI